MRSEIVTQCTECPKPVAKNRRRYCGAQCAGKAWKRMNIDRANEHAARQGGSAALHRRQRYGISQEQYDEMMARQRGRCGICKRKSAKLHIDHDHDTGKVRELLCRNCNLGIGKLGEDPARLRAAAAYVEAHRG